MRATIFARFSYSIWAYTPHKQMMTSFQNDCLKSSKEARMKVLLPSWRTTLRRKSNEMPSPIRRTHGNSLGRIQWRFKKTSGYTEVSIRWGERSNSNYIVAVQDNAFFTKEMKNVVWWSDINLVHVEDHKKSWRRLLEIWSWSLPDLIGT